MAASFYNNIVISQEAFGAIGRHRPRGPHQVACSNLRSGRRVQLSFDLTMSDIWFTADFHLGHRNIIRYCGRPFRDVVEMDYPRYPRYHAVVISISRSECRVRSQGSDSMGLVGAGEA